jgi:CRP/FNR family transcriptional regulator, cyclic AMP receptor protein
MEFTGLPGFAAYRLDWPEQAFLARIPEDVVADCFRAGRFAWFAPGAIMIDEHAEDQTVYLLVSGYVKVFSKSTGALLAIRVGGDVVGELSLLDRGPRSASVAVCSREAALACVLDRAAFTDVLTRYPAAHVVLSSVIGAKLRASTRRRVDIVGSSSFVRMARMLVELADDYGQPSHDRRGALIGIKLNQVELGSLIGVSAPTAQRALRRLRELGLIDTNGRPLIIHDLARLRVLASSSDDGEVETAER